MDSVEIKTMETKSRSPDRISLGLAEAQKVEGWLKQVHERSKGFLALNKSDLVNFLIREHKDELSVKEIGQIRADNYDPIRHINWITQELKVALAKNDMAAVAMLQEEIKGIELSVVAYASGVVAASATGAEPPPPLMRKLRRAKKNSSDAEGPETLAAADSQAHLP